MKPYMRSELVLGKEKMTRLKNVRILLCGLGGVGSFVAESLYRTGIKKMTFVDYDDIQPSNLNRQLEATKDTIGRKKTEAMKERLLAIYPDGEIDIISTMVSEENIPSLFNKEYDFVIDAIDTVSAKVALAYEADKRRIPFIGAMGCGNKLDPSKLKIMLLSQTRICPLARVVRKKASQLNIDFPVCVSEEAPVIQAGRDETIGSVIFVPGMAGLMMSAYVIDKI